jgi:hypothetical protein
LCSCFSMFGRNIADQLVLHYVDILFCATISPNEACMSNYCDSIFLAELDEA